MDRSALTGLLVAVAALLVATLAGVWWRRRDGRLVDLAGEGHTRVDVPSRSIGSAGDAGGSDGEHASALAALGVSPGRVTLLQFSSAFCTPCRVARRVCDEVARAYEGVVHIEIDAESHLAEVRRLGIWRTPTVLVVDTAGQVVQRATGAPAREHVIEAVTALLPAAT